MPSTYHQTNFSCANYVKTLLVKDLFWPYAQDSANPVSWGTRPALMTSKTWVRTPGYRAKKKAGTLPLNDMSFLRQELSTNFTPTAFRVSSDNQRYVAISEFCSFAAFMSHPPYGNSCPTARLSSVMVSRLKTGGTSIPTSLIEGKKTVDMITSTSTRLYKGIRALKKGDVRGFTKQLGIESPNMRSVKKFNKQYGKDPMTAAGNTWLEYKYGWTPLLMDVKAQAELVARMMVDPSHSLSVIRGKARDVVKDGGSGNYPGSGTFGFGYTWTETRTSSLRGTWRFYPKPGSTAVLSGIANPAQVAWEIIPFSFVVDWFLPIGDYLDSLDAYLLYTHKDYTIGCKTFSERIYRCGGEQGLATSLQVRALVQGGPPTLSIVDIKIDPKLSIQKAVTSLALLRQVLVGLKRS